MSLEELKLVRGAWHPGQTLRQYLEQFGVTPHAVARAIGVPPIRINDIVRGKRGITPDTALRLGHYFGTSPKKWTGGQLQYELARGFLDHGARIEAEIAPHPPTLTDP